MQYKRPNKQNQDQTTKNEKKKEKLQNKGKQVNTTWPCSNSTKQNIQTRTKKKLQTFPLQIIFPAMCCPSLKGKKKWLNKVKIHKLSNVKQI